MGECKSKFGKGKEQFVKMNLEKTQTDRCGTSTLAHYHISIL
jgi:hypothetical protein